MPGSTISDDIEIIDAGHGGGIDIPAGGDGDGEGSGSNLPRIPSRAYFTAVQLSLAAIVMFFMALTSSFLVRKGLGNDWISFALPRILWFNIICLCLPAAQRLRSRAVSCGRELPPLSTVGGPWPDRFGPDVSRRAACGSAPVVRPGRLHDHQSEQQLFLFADGVARAAPFGRRCGRLFCMYPFTQIGKRSRITQSTAADLVNRSIGTSWMGFGCSLFALLWHLGRVNRARNEERRRGGQFAVVRRTGAICDQLEKAGNVAVYRLRHADVLGHAFGIHL